VTLVFYRVGSQWWKEPALNLLAAAAQMSSYTHVELAIGEVPGSNGMMANVARIFNDSTGVELCERTGRNPQVRRKLHALHGACAHDFFAWPQYTYLSLGCSKNAEQRMLKFTREQVGKPFDNMVRLTRNAASRHIDSHVVDHTHTNF
jgi:hypothetical protein